MAARQPIVTVRREDVMMERDVLRALDITRMDDVVRERDGGCHEGN